MKDMLKQQKATLWITGILILLPMLAGVLLWNRLPEQIATSFDMEGMPNGYSSKAFAVLGIPLFIFACQWFSVLYAGMDPKRRNINGKVFRMLLWVCPAVSIFAMSSMYAYALGHHVSMSMLCGFFVGFLFIIIGNYLPKCRQSYTLGLRFPWTLSDEENWNQTHRMAGPLWMIAGIIMMVCAFFPAYWMPAFLAVMVVAIGVPTIYSYLLAKKKGQV